MRTDRNCKQAYNQHDDNAVLAKASFEKFALQHVKVIHVLDSDMGIAKIWNMYRQVFYNNRRPHMRIGMRIPMEAFESTRPRDMRCTSDRNLAIRFMDNLDIPECSLPLPPCQGSLSGLHPLVNPDNDMAWIITYLRNIY